MNLSILSYNLEFNKALESIDKVLVKTKPDILCLQEMETTEDNLALLRNYGYSLADFSNSFIKYGRVWGQATFYNKKTVQFISSVTLNLPRSYYEVILRILRGVNEPRTVLKTEFLRKNSQTSFVIYNVHLSSYQATNRTRARQITKMLDDLDLHIKNPVIITGDFNYPYGRKRFEKLIAEYNLKEATNNLYYTSIFRLLKILPFKFKVDYILYRDLKLRKTVRVPVTSSDHFPILSMFTV